VESLVLDTDAASHLQRRTLPASLQEHIVGRILCVTFITVGEIFKGAFMRGWGEKRVQELETWLRNVVVLPYTGEVSRAWGRLTAECEAMGRPIPANDAWIAACCLSHDLPLMTLNRRHLNRFRDFGSCLQRLLWTGERLAAAIPSTATMPLVANEMRRMPPASSHLTRTSTTLSPPARWPESAGAP